MSDADEIAERKAELVRRPIMRLTDAEVMQVLGDRERDKRLAGILDTLGRMLELSARKRPELAPGLIAGAELIKLYRQAVLPDGSFVLAPDAVAKIMSDVPTPTKAAPLAKPVSPPPPERAPSKTAQARNAGGWYYDERSMGKASRVARQVARQFRDGREFAVSDIEVPFGCTKQDVSNALTTLRYWKACERMSWGIYRLTPENIHGLPPIPEQEKVVEPVASQG